MDVYNFYSLVNGIIMALAGFNYLALRYENHLNSQQEFQLLIMFRNPPSSEKRHQRLFVCQIACANE